MMPVDDETLPLTISAKNGWSRTMAKIDVYFLDGDCSARQGNNVVQGPRAVVWIDKEPLSDGVRHVTVYMESAGNEEPIRMELSAKEAGARITDRKWIGQFSTREPVKPLVMNRLPSQYHDPAIYQRGLQAMSPDNSVIRQVQFVSGMATPPAPVPVPSQPPFRRIRFSPRSDERLDFRFEAFPDNPERGIAVINKGFNVIIEGIDKRAMADNQMMLAGNVVDLSADHAVIWGANPSKMHAEDDETVAGTDDFEIYMEGNIIFRDGERRIEANRMYYDAKNELAYIIDGDLTMPLVGLPGAKGSFRIKAQTIQKLGNDTYTAKNGLATTSMLGEPTYSLHAKTMRLDSSNDRQFLVAENNYLAARKLPILYWPWMAADLKDPVFYIKQINYGYDSVDGHAVKTAWNPFQILNIRNRPRWLDADLAVDWIEKRGIGHGTHVTYTPPSFCGFGGPVKGAVGFWGISDSGKDRLGGSRRAVGFPDKYRYRVFWEHDQKINFGKSTTDPWTLNASVGKVSDRNFMNYWYTRQWNDEENRTTRLGLKKICGNSSLSLFTEYALDDFYSNPNWLPRADHTWIGESLLGDRLTWYEHTRVGFLNYHTAAAPTDPQDIAVTTPLPWDLGPNSNVYGEVFSTRHEFDLPFNVGPIRCVPYVLGDFSHWGKNQNDKSVDRFYGQAGVRLNLPFWKVFPGCSSRTWYVNGLAHKIDFDTEFSYGRADKPMDDLLMSDSLDSWSVEDARRRYKAGAYSKLGNDFLLRFDPRYYALRSGMAGNVTAPNMEIADDMTLCRFGMTHRFQTKRGPVGHRRIIDWITLSAHFNYYPEAKYNYGQNIGLIDYSALWNVGDRLALFSSGIYDTFEKGQNVTRIGGMWERPDRGSLTLGVDRYFGLFKQTLLNLSLRYDMNEKYSLTYATSYDMLNNWKNQGHTFMFSRTGESFRILVGLTYNEKTSKTSFTFGLEPVFLYGIAGKMRNMSQAQTQSSR